MNGDTTHKQIQQTFKALISQNATNAPVNQTIYENTGGPIDLPWSRISEGIYTLSIAGDDVTDGMTITQLGYKNNSKPLAQPIFSIGTGVIGYVIIYSTGSSIFVGCYDTAGAPQDLSELIGNDGLLYVEANIYRNFNAQFPD